MNLTNQQTAILNHVQSTEGLTLIDSVAGSGKTTMLTSIAKAINPKSAIYLAYNKSVALEAASKFPSSVHCSTTHSLAYQAIVKPNGLKLGFFTYRDLPYDIPYEERVEYINLFRQFCLSSELSLSSFLKSYGVHPDHIKMLVGVANAMASGKRDCTHEFYLKNYHLSLANGTLEYDPFDLVMLDEAGDLNPVTLEIFKLLPAKRKVMVGDPYQNIYSFNHTINCFEVMHGKGTCFNMSKSFRVNEHIAKGIESFVKTYINPDMEFEGVPTNSNISTRAFISRTNSALIDKMFELNAIGAKYGLTRKASQIFELPKIICGLKYKGFVPNPEYKHLQEAVNAYYEDSSLSKNYKNHLVYLKALYMDEPAIATAVTTVLKHGKSGIMQCYTEAKKHEAVQQSYMLGTSHSMKGLEFDEVTLADDLNKTVSKVLSKVQLYGSSILTADEKSEINLYYVACSRSRIKLNNATFIQGI